MYFLRQVLGIPVASKEVLRQRTDDYRGWVEAYARNHKVAMEWAEKDVRKENRVFPELRRMGEEERFRRLLYLQEHGAGPHFPHQSAEVSHQGPQLPHPGAPAEPLHAFLLLCSRRRVPLTYHLCLFHALSCT